MGGWSAVVFGCGKMACGLLGHLLERSGYATTFVARRPEVAELINRKQGYVLDIAGVAAQRYAIRNCSALPLQDRESVAEAVADADLVFTAVGIDNLSAITPAIADGLWRRGRTLGDHPLNVIASENLPGAGAYLRHQVLSAAPLRVTLTVERVGGFSAALTRRIMTGGAIENGALAFAVDEEAVDLVIDQQGLKGTFPELHGATITEEFPAMVLRKLFMLNCAHAVAAYLGYRVGCRYVHEAVVHPRVEPTLQAAVAEARAALRAELPHHGDAIDRDARESLERIGNPALMDPIARVARDPRRKLAARERLLGPARLAVQHGLPHENLCQAIVAALAYDDPGDPQAVAMQRVIATEGLDKVLTEDCGLLPHEALAREIKRQWATAVQDGAGYLGAPFGLATGTRPSLERIVRTVTADLSRRYDSALVEEIVTRVAVEFREARVWSYVPILLEREASHRLSGVTRDRLLSA